MVTINALSNHDTVAMVTIISALLQVVLYSPGEYLKLVEQ